MQTWLVSRECRNNSRLMTWRTCSQIFKHWKDNGVFCSLDHDWVTWGTARFSKQWKDNGTFWSLDYDWMTQRPRFSKQWKDNGTFWTLDHDCMENTIYICKTLCKRSLNVWHNHASHITSQSAISRPFKKQCFSVIGSFWSCSPAEKYNTKEKSSSSKSSRMAQRFENVSLYSSLAEFAKIAACVRRPSVRHPFMMNSHLRPCTILF